MGGIARERNVKFREREKKWQRVREGPLCLYLYLCTTNGSEFAEVLCAAMRQRMRCVCGAAHAAAYALRMRGMVPATCLRKSSELVCAAHAAAYALRMRYDRGMVPATCSWKSSELVCAAHAAA
jgi:hypothetical protein